MLKFDSRLFGSFKLINLSQIISIYFKDSLLFIYSISFNPNFFGSILRYTCLFACVLITIRTCVS